MNQLVNKAESDMVAEVNLNQQAYLKSQSVVVAFALGSILLALILVMPSPGRCLGRSTDGSAAA